MTTIVPRGSRRQPAAPAGGAGRARRPGQGRDLAGAAARDRGRGDPDGAGPPAPGRARRPQRRRVPPLELGRRLPRGRRRVRLVRAADRRSSGGCRTASAADAEASVRPSSAPCRSRPAASSARRSASTKRLTGHEAPFLKEHAGRPLQDHDAGAVLRGGARVQARRHHPGVPDPRGADATTSSTVIRRTRSSGCSTRGRAVHPARQPALPGLHRGEPPPAVARHRHRPGGGDPRGHRGRQRLHRRDRPRRRRPSPRTSAAATAGAPGTPRAATSRSPSRCSAAWTSTRFLLEYDTDRAGGFEPLRFIPKGKNVVLGLVTTKVGDAGVAGRAAAAHRGGVEVRPDREPVAEPAVRLRLGGPGQPALLGRAAAQAGAGGRAPPARSGAEREGSDLQSGSVPGAGAAGIWPVPADAFSAGRSRSASMEASLEQFQLADELGFDWVTRRRAPLRAVLADAEPDGHGRRADPAGPPREDRAARARTSRS